MTDTTAISAFGSVAHLRIGGSDTLGAKLVPLLSESFGSDHPDVRFTLDANGTTAGINSLLEGTLDIALTSRPLTELEANRFIGQNLRVTSIVAAIHAYALAFNEANLVAELSADQIIPVFTGEITTWAELRGSDIPVIAYARNPASGTHQDFRRLALRDRAYGPSSQTETPPGS